MLKISVFYLEHTRGSVLIGLNSLNLWHMNGTSNRIIDVLTLIWAALKTGSNVRLAVKCI